MFSEMEFLLFLYDIIGYLVLICNFYYIVLKEKERHCPYFTYSKGCNFTSSLDKPNH